MSLTWTDALELLSRQKRLTWSALPAELSVAIAEALLTHDAGRLAPRGEPAAELRDRLAAAAPPVPEWFTHDEHAPRPAFFNGDTWLVNRIGKRPANFPDDNGAAAIYEAKLAACGAEYDAAEDAARREREAWTQRDQMSRETQWRWRFAEAMLAERGRRRERWEAEAQLQQLRDEDAAPDDAPELE